MFKKIIYKLYERHINKKFHNPYALAADFIHDYRQHRTSFFKIYKIHKKGFTVDDWNLMSLNNDNYKQYVSSAQYASLHPINGQYSKWIDDKLTLKYLCYGTNLSKYFPKYYIFIDENGLLIPLCDYDNKDSRLLLDGNDIYNLLVQEKVLAFKQTASSLGLGFYKICINNAKILINDKEFNKFEFLSFVSNLRSYLIIEFLKPNPEIGKFYNNATNTIRYVQLNHEGSLTNLVSFVRFGCKSSRYVDNYGSGGILCYLDEIGAFKEGNIADFKNNKNKKIFNHPDNNLPLKSTIPLWNSIVKAANEFSLHFPQLKYLGFDFVVTDKNEVKILEINSLTSLDTIQLDKSIYDLDITGFFKNHVHKMYRR